MLTTKGRYAVMAMVDMAQRACGDAPITLGDIAARQQIALNYLEQIFAKLRKGGLVQAYRGPGGGYVLAKESSAIWVSDIIIAVEESIKITRCSADKSAGCMHDKTRCLTHDLWEGLGNQIYGYLRSISLADICNGTIVVEKEVGEKSIEAFSLIPIEGDGAKECYSNA